MDMRTGTVVAMLLQEEWRQQAALDRKAAEIARRKPSLVPQLSPRRGWLDRVLRRPLVQPAAEAR
jgi:hypothetical protein